MLRGGWNGRVSFLVLTLILLPAIGVLCRAGTDLPSLPEWKPAQQRWKSSEIDRSQHESPKDAEPSASDRSDPTATILTVSSSTDALTSVTHQELVKRPLPQLINAPLLPEYRSKSVPQASRRTRSRRGTVDLGYTKIVMYQDPQGEGAANPPLLPNPELPDMLQPNPELPDSLQPNPELPDSSNSQEPIRPVTERTELAGASGATGFSPPAEPTPAPSQEINTQVMDIKTLPNTVGQLLESAPSVNTRRTSPLTIDTRIRGFTTQQLVGTASGVNQLKTRVDIDSLFSTVDPGLIQNAKVYNGPYTSLYGPGLGFIISDMRESPRYEDGTEAHVYSTVDYGTNGGTFYNRDSLEAGGKNWGVFFSYGLRFATDFRPGGASDFNSIPGGYQNWNGYLATGLDIGDYSRVEFDFLRNEINNLQLAGVIYDINSMVTNQYNVRYIVQEDRSGPQKFMVQYWNSRDDYNGNSLRYNKHVTFYDQFITQNFSGFVVQPQFNLTNTFVFGNLQSQGIRSLMTLGEEDYILATFGADFRRYSQFYVEQNVDGTGKFFTGPFGPAPSGIPYSSMNDYGLFTDVRIPVSEDVKITAGGRVDFTQTYVDTDDAVSGGGPSPGFSNSGYTTPNHFLGMAYIAAETRLTEKFYLENGMGFGMRNPTLSELYSKTVFTPLIRSGNSIAVGNSDLRPEQNTQFDLGLSRRGEIINSSIRGYYSNVTDFILYDFQGVAGNPINPDPNNPVTSKVYQYTNLARATLYGSDAFIDVKIFDGLAAFGTAAYVRGINNSPQIGGADNLPGIYPFNGSVGLRYFDQKEDRWGVTGITRMAMSQNVVANTLFELPTPGFVTFDLLGYYRFTDNIKATSAIINVFDRSYTQHGSLLLTDRLAPASSSFTNFTPNPGITARFGLEMTF